MQNLRRDFHCTSIALFLNLTILGLLQQPLACEDAWCNVSIVTAFSVSTVTMKTSVSSGKLRTEFPATQMFRK
jgi:hypothetical protein